MADEKLDPDFADLPPEARAEIEGSLGIGLHHAPASGAYEGADDAFRHPERDAAGTTWEPDWEPIETYRDGEVVMLDDGGRQLLGRRDMGLWMQIVGGDEIAQPDYQPMLWSRAPEQVRADMIGTERASSDRRPIRSGS